MSKKGMVLLSAVFAVTLFAAGENKPVMEPDENTAAFWDFRTVRNNVIEDSSGFGNGARLCSFDKAPLPAATPDGMKFNNQGGFAEVYGKESLRIVKGDFSIDVVFKSDSEEFLRKTTSIYLVGNKAASEKNGFALALVNWKKPHFAFFYGQDGQRLTLEGRLPAALTAGEFHHVQVSRTGEKLAIYLDGEKLGEEERKGDISLVNPRKIRIGIYPAPWKRDNAGRLMTEGLDGVIRFVRISDKGRGGK